MKNGYSGKWCFSYGEPLLEDLFVVEDAELYVETQDCGTSDDHSLPLVPSFVRDTFLGHSYQKWNRNQHAILNHPDALMIQLPSEYLSNRYCFP